MKIASLYACTRFGLCWIAFLIALGNSQSAHCQTLGPIPELAVEFAPVFQYDLTEDIFYTQILYSKISSSAQVIPELKSTGKVQTIFMSAGTRTKSFESFDFRWRAGLLNMDVIRTPLSMGATLLDYNKSGRMEVDIRWANFRLGPSLFIGTPSNYMSIRAVGSAGLTTAKLGTFAYAEDFGDGAISGLASSEALTLRKRSYEVGYLGEASFFFVDRIALGATFSHRHLLGGVRPKFYEIKGVVGVRVNTYISIQGSYSIEITRAGSATLESSFIGFSLGLLI